MGVYKKNWLTPTELQIIKLTEDFTLDDWSIMRNNDYWDERDAMPKHNDRCDFLLQTINEYLLT